MINNITYRRHVIKTRQYGNDWRAAAFRGNIKVTDNLPAATEILAVQVVKNELDETAAKQKARRGADGFPTAEEVHNAFHVLKITKNQEAMLLAHRNAREQILTATLLAEAAGYSDYEVANSQYGQLGRALAEELDWTPQEKTADGKTIWTFALATDANDKSREKGEHWRWKLRPEIVAALSK